MCSLPAVNASNVETLTQHFYDGSGGTCVGGCLALQVGLFKARLG